jgi:hypothetical protein
MDDEHYILRHDIPGSAIHSWPFIQFWTGWKGQLPTLTEPTTLDKIEPFTFQAKILGNDPDSQKDCAACNWRWHRSLLQAPISLASIEQTLPDYPYNNLNWPVMSRKMLEVLRTVGDFEHQIIPINVDLADGKVNADDYVAVQFTRHYDLLDTEQSSYLPEVVFRTEVRHLSRIKLRTTDKELPPVLRMSGYPWLLTVTAKGREALTQAGIIGVAYQKLAKRRNFVDDLETFSPAELHGFCEGYNWDDGEELMCRIAAMPTCDKGTASLIFWLFDPIINMEEGSGFEFEILQDLQKRYVSGFYSYNTIRFDPTVDMGFDWTAEAREKNYPLPEEMFKPNL